MAKRKLVNNVRTEVRNESKLEQSAVPTNAQVPEVKVSFDVWFASRQKRIPTHHYKEIILADMKARGVVLNNTMAKFDEALGKYGVQLK